MKRYVSKATKLRRRIVTVVVAFFLIGIVVFVQRNITGVLKSIAESSMRSITTVAVNDAIYYTLSDHIRYEDLVAVERDEVGNILAITSNSLQINRIARDTAYMSQQNLQTMSEGGIEIPLGALTGVEAWAGFGPKIHVKIIPISNVACRFVSSFESAGINQTKHSIYLEIVADISIVMPSGTCNFASLTEVLICESVLLGKVPDTYLQADIFGNGYPLAPSGKVSRMSSNISGVPLLISDSDSALFSAALPYAASSASGRVSSMSSRSTAQSPLRSK